MNIDDVINSFSFHNFNRGVLGAFQTLFFVDFGIGCEVEAGEWGVPALCEMEVLCGPWG
jgi:hypothetical protein